MVKSPEIPLRKTAITKTNPDPEGRIKQSTEKKKHLSKKALVGRLAVALFIIANAGMGVKHHVDFEIPNTPAGIWQDVKGIPTEWQYTILKWQQDKTVADRLNQPVPPTFDNRADEQLIHAGINAVPVSQEKALSLIRENPIPELMDNELPTFSMLFFAKLTTGGTAIVETDYVDQALNPITRKPDRINSGKFVTFSKAGAELIVPFEEVELFQIDPTVINNKEYFAGFVMRFRDSDGITYTMSIKAPDDIRDLASTDNVKNAPKIGKNGVFLGTQQDWEELGDIKVPIVPAGTVIGKTTKDGARIRVGVGARTDKYPKGLPVILQFFTQNDGQLVIQR